MKKNRSFFTNSTTFDVALLFDESANNIRQRQKPKNDNNDKSPK